MLTDRGIRRAFSFAALFVVAAGAAAQTSDGPRIGRPGSLLVFPVFDTRANVHTKLVITNVNRANRTCANRFRIGDVQLHYVFVDGATCQLFDRRELLAPGDTLAVDVATYQPNFDHGWAWV